MPTLNGSMSTQRGSNQTQEEALVVAESTVQADSSADATSTLQIRVKMVNEQVHVIATSATTTTKEFRVQIEQATNVPIHSQRLIYRGKLMRDDLLPLGAYKLQDGHTVHLITRPRSPAMAVVPAVTASNQLEPGINVEATPESLESPERVVDPVRLVQRRAAWVASAASSSSSSSSSSASSSETGHVHTLRPARSEHLRIQPQLVSPRSSIPVPNEQSGGGARPDAWPPSATRHPLRVDDPVDDTETIQRITTTTMTAAATAMNTTTNTTTMTNPLSNGAMNLDHLRQGLLTLRTILSTSVHAEHHAVVASPEFFVGQWIDVRDTVNQWLECTVLEISETQVLVHYHGWPSRWDEWIDKNSDRLAAFRTRTEHQLQLDRVSPMPRTRYARPGSGVASNVDGNDTNSAGSSTTAISPEMQREEMRQMVPQLRDMMRDILPHLESLAALCEEHNNVQGDSSSDISNLVHLLAPAFDRFGRLLTDSARAMNALVDNDLRHQIQQHRSRGSAAPSQLANTELDHRLDARDHQRQQTHDRPHDEWYFAARDLITTPSQMPFPPAADTRPRGSIDVHIHAIVAPTSLSSLLSLARASGRNALGSSSLGTTPAPENRPRNRASTGARLARELLIEEMNRPIFNASQQRQRQREQEDTARQVTRLLQAQRRQRERSGNANGEHHSSELTPLLNAYPRTMSAPDSLTSFNHDEASTRTSPYDLMLERSESDEVHIDGSARTRYLIPEVAEAQARHSAAASQFRSSELRASQVESNESGSTEAVSDNPRPTFLEVLRRTLSGVRNTFASLNSPPRPDDRTDPITWSDEDETTRSEVESTNQPESDIDMEFLPDLESLD